MIQTSVDELIRSLRAQGRTDALTTELIEEAERLRDRVVVMNTRFLIVSSPGLLRGALPGVAQGLGVNDANV